MRDVVIIGVACVIAIAIGVWLYAGPGVAAPVAPVGISVLDQGNTSGAINERTNYRIRSQDELDQLWRMVHGTGAPATVDFTTSDVLAVFDGTHTTGGYEISVTDVAETGGKEMVSILHSSPGASCLTNQMITSPYQIIVVAKSSLPLSHQDVTQVKECN